MPQGLCAPRSDRSAERSPLGAVGGRGCGASDGRPAALPRASWRAAIVVVAAVDDLDRAPIAAARGSAGGGGRAGASAGGEAQRTPPRRRRGCIGDAEARTRLAARPRALGRGEPWPLGPLGGGDALPAAVVLLLLLLAAATVAVAAATVAARQGPPPLCTGAAPTGCPRRLHRAAAVLGWVRASLPRGRRWVRARCRGILPLGPPVAEAARAMGRRGGIVRRSSRPSGARFRGGLSRLIPGVPLGGSGPRLLRPLTHQASDRSVEVPLGSARLSGGALAYLRLDLLEDLLDARVDGLPVVLFHKALERLA
mmetsp:Transcript_42637/g.101246  ORF Transcript_42637/g.101246 Transcript_42637/m.101246 type:complete len:311 (-) Transcript_42637:1457-2389(-)